MQAQFDCLLLFFLFHRFYIFFFLSHLPKTVDIECARTFFPRVLAHTIRQRKKKENVVAKKNKCADVDDDDDYDERMNVSGTMFLLFIFTVLFWWMNFCARISLFLFNVFSFHYTPAMTFSFLCWHTRSFAFVFFSFVLQIIDRSLDWIIREIEKRIRKTIKKNWNHFSVFHGANESNGKMLTPTSQVCCRYLIADLSMKISHKLKSHFFFHSILKINSSKDIRAQWIWLSLPTMQKPVTLHSRLATQIMHSSIKCQLDKAVQSLALQPLTATDAFKLSTNQLQTQFQTSVSNVMCAV